MNYSEELTLAQRENEAVKGRKSDCQIHHKVKILDIHKFRPCKLLPDLGMQ